MKKLAVLLLGYGAPASLAEAKNFVKNLLVEITARQPSIETLKEAEKKYQAVGGSPYLKISQKQKELLENYLKEKLQGREVFLKLAYRYSQPSFPLALDELLAFHPDSLFLLSLSPFPSPYGSTGYFEMLRSLLKKRNFSGKTFFITDWVQHPHFFKAWEEKIRETWGKIPEYLKGQTQLIFTFHSLPVRAALTSPEYQKTTTKISRKLSEKLKIKGEIAFQSGKGESWIGPSLKTVIKKTAEKEVKALVVVPLGFISDHLETLYDLDIEAKAEAEKLGLKFYRVPALNDSPLLIQAIGSSIIKRV